MSPRRQSFYRKIGYVVGMVVIFIPLSRLSMPGTSDEAQDAGILASQRRAHGLGVASLGEIDPASETMKLATLGLQGIATNVLWNKAIHYKRTEDWTNFAGTLDQLRKLQPHFISVWRYQGWNLSYNLSVEFDDYRDRYDWVIRGIEFLKEGERYNRDEPRLMWDIGWFIAQKIGRADERRQYRRLFREDDDFHAGTGRTRQERDNWLVGKTWFQRAVDADMLGRKKMKGQGPLLFKSHPPKAQIDYAEAIQEEGNHGEIARLAWKKADQEWHEYGNESILTSYGTRIHLNDQERLEEEAKQYAKRLDELGGGVHDKLYRDKFLNLSEEERALAEQEIEDVPPKRRDRWWEVQDKLEVRHGDVARYIREQDPDLAVEATRLARLAAEAEQTAKNIANQRQIVNFEYWRDRCEFEQIPEVLAARELLYQADEAHDDQDLIRSKELYEQSWELWEKVLKRELARRVIDEGTLGEEIVDEAYLYRRVLNDLDEEFPEDFALAEVIRDNDVQGLMYDLFPPRQDTGFLEEPDQRASATEPESQAGDSSGAKMATGKPGEKDEASSATPEPGMPPEPEPDPTPEAGAPPEP